MKRNNLILMSLAGILLTSCGAGDKSDKASAEAIKVKVTTISPTTVDGKSAYSGTVEEENATLVSFSVAGTVKSIHVGLGDRVRKGQLIATLDKQQIESSWRAAKSTLDQAEDAYKRMQKLHEGGSLPDIKWVEAESKLHQAQSMEEIARKNLADCQLYAPFDGVVAEKQAEVGTNVMPGMAIVKVVSGQKLKVKIAVPESEIAQIKTGQKALIRVEALGGRTISGTVAEKGIVANPLSRSYDVKFRLDAASASGLMPGMVADVVMVDGGEGQAACVLPERLVQLDEHNNRFVWIAKGKTAIRRTVEIGDYTAHGVTIKSGLSYGDMVISEGQQKVCEGSKITY